MKNIIAALLLTSFVAPALSTTIHLKCEGDRDSDIISLTVTLNEETKKIVHQERGGAVLETNGKFTSEAVTYKELIKPPGIEHGMTHTYTIDRMDLSFKKITTIDWDVLAGESSTDYATCKLVDAPKKAF